MKTNTHNQNHLTTTPADSQEPKRLYERILLGIDQHAADQRIVSVPIHVLGAPAPVNAVFLR